MIKENAALRRLYYRTQMLRPKAQSDECQIIDQLTKNAPRTFIEFGFHPIEFNCSALAQDPTWGGLLVDGNNRQVMDAKALLPGRLKIVEAFLTLENIDFIKSEFQKIGVLSIDVDGNDYWFLKELISTDPFLICIEYNSSLGHEPIAVPYEKSFDRYKKHPRAWYHGASLSALFRLCSAYGYGLAAISESGTNAFFTRTGNLDPIASWRPNRLREKFSGIAHEQQWQSLKDLPFIRV
jgi:hypothetical protein